MILSDLHAHNWTRFATTLPDGTNSRYADLWRVLDEAHKLMRKERVGTLLLLGDLTHRRYYVNFSIYTPLMEWLLRLQREEDIKVIALVGNHDVESHGHHSLGPLRAAGIYVIDRPEYVMIDGHGWYYFVPYMDGEAVAEAFRAGANYTARNGIAFGHYALDGTVLTNEYAVPTALRHSDLDGFEQVILGHVHAPSVDRKVTYVGAPLHFDFGDSGPRFAWLLHDDGSLRSERLHGPQFVTTTYPRIPATTMDGYLRVLNAPANEFEDIKRTGVEMGWRDVLPVEAAMPLEAVRAITSAVFVDEQIIRDYVQRHYPDVADDTRERLVAFALECVRAVS